MQQPDTISSENLDKGLENQQKKTLVFGLILLIIVVLVALFYFKRKSENKENNTLSGLGSPESKIELVVINKQVALNEGISISLYFTQAAFSINQLWDCAKGAEKTRQLFESGFNTEALFEYATITCQLLNRQLGFVLPEQQLSFYKAINLAFKKNLINSRQKAVLHALRQLRNKKAHQAGTEFGPATTKYYFIHTFMINDKFLC